MALSAQQPAPPQAATPAAARAFLDEANRELLRLVNASNRAGWTQGTYITVDTEQIAAEANAALVSAATRYALEARRFDAVTLPPEERRQLDVLKNSLTMSAPPDPKEAEELTRLVASMEGVYGSGKYCPKGATGEECLDIEAITRFLADSRDPKWLQEVWEGWHTIAVPMKKDYARFVELSNKGAKALGFADTGAMWRGKYDMPPDAFAKELDRLWEQVRPLYLSLHAYVRAKLREKYGAAVPEKGPIPAHLLGNMWQQNWANVYPLVAPAGRRAGLSLTEILKAKKTDAARDGAHRRAVLHVARLRAAAEDVLGAVAVRQAARSRGRLPRERVGRRQRRRPAHQDVHRRQPPRTSRRSTTSSATTSTSAPTTRCR